MKDSKGTDIRKGSKLYRFRFGIPEKEQDRVIDADSVLEVTGMLEDMVCVSVLKDRHFRQGETFVLSQEKVNSDQYVVL